MVKVEPWLAALVLLATAGCATIPEPTPAPTPADRREAECRVIRATNEPLADQGDLEALYQMARLYETGCAVPYRLSYAYLNYKYAAERGHSRSALQLGNFYLGKGSIRRTWDKALFWFAVAEREPGLTSSDRAQIGYSRRIFLNYTLDGNGSERMKRAEEKAAAWTPRTD